MANQVLYAHTGEVFDYDPAIYSSLDEFKQWIAEQVNIPPANQILTTVKGALVKFPALSSERELFLYSRHYIVPNAPTTAPILSIPAISKPQPAPDRIENQNDLSAWKTLFANRLAWANGILAHANMLVAEIEDVNNGIAVMQRSVSVAASNLDTHVKSAVGNYDEMKGWAYESLRDQEKMLGGWESSLSRLPKIPVQSEISRVMRKGEVKNLMGMVDAEEVKRAGRTLGDLATGFERKVTQLGASVQQIRHLTEALSEEMEFGRKETEDPSPEEARYLLTDIAAVVQKIQQDHDHIGAMSSTPKAIPPAQKAAHNHTTDLLPNLAEWILEMGRLGQSAVERKNAVSKLCLKNLQTVSQLEQRLYTDLISPVKRAEPEYEKESAASYQLLTLVTHLPSIYGSFLVECVRRKEWNERMRTDSAKLAEELAGLKEEEEKRRKKWYKNATDEGALTIDFLPAESATGGMSLDLNLAADSKDWPNIARSELDDLLTTLKNVEGLDSLVRDLAQQMIDLDKPSRRQKRSMTPALATRAFKMGSIHEAALGHMSMLKDVDENVQIKMLKDDRAKWDDRVKMYESRIRKLEDLLHRQRHGGYVGGVQFGQLNNSAQSPVTAEPMSRNGSSDGHGVNMPMIDRRGSTDGPQKMFIAKIANLEKELAAEKEKITVLQQDMEKRDIAEKNLSERMTEAVDTKKDLLGNLEQQRSEFQIERSELQEKLRDLEESLDGWKQRVEEVYTECDKLEDLRLEEARKREVAEEEIASIDAELKAVKEDASNHGTKVAAAEAEAARAATELTEFKASHEQRFSELHATHTGREDEIAQKERELKAEKAQNEELHEVIASLRKKLIDSEQNLQEERNWHQRSNETESSASKLLKNAFTALRETLGDAYPSARSPSDNLATLPVEVQGVAHSAAKEITHLQFKFAQEQIAVKSLRMQNQQIQARLDARTLRARDLTQKLYTHNMRAVQMLENLGFSVAVRDGSTQITRISRSSNANSTANINESLSMSMSVLPVMTKQKFTDGNNNSFNDLELLYWMEAEDSDRESEKYAAYIDAIGNFDADGFTEALTKRVKDLETSARKWQKHSRDYRDRYHRMQSESNEKIAFRSFKEGDLAMFLPTRNQVTKPWAAFNVGAPHYFLREQDGHKLATRDWLVARISKVEERIVDLSRSTASIGVPPGMSLDRSSINSSEGGIDDENPFQLSDGLRWYLLDAVEEKPGAPTTPGLGSSTVASANVDAKSSLKSRKPVTGAKKTLSKNLQQGGNSSMAGEANSVKSKTSLTSLGQARGSGGSGGVQKPQPPITNFPDGAAVVDAAEEAGSRNT